MLHYFQQAWGSTRKSLFISHVTSQVSPDFCLFRDFKKEKRSQVSPPTHPNFLVFGKYIYIYMWCIVLNLCSVKRKFQCLISQPRKIIFTWNFEGGLIDHQSCFTQNLKFLAVQEPNFLEPKFGQNRLLTGFCMYIGPASVFVLFLDLTSGLCRAVFPMYLVSPIGLPAY